MSKSWPVIIATLVIAVAVGGGLTWWFTVGNVGTPAETIPTPRPVPTDDSTTAAAALESLESDPSVLLPVELADTVGTGIEEAIPPGTTVHADPTTWLPSEAGGGVIEVELTYPDGATSTVAAIMVKEPDGWKVLQTIALEPKP